MSRERRQFLGALLDLPAKLPLLIAQIGCLARASAHVTIYQGGGQDDETDIQQRTTERDPAGQAKVRLPAGRRRRQFGALFLP